MGWQEMAEIGRRETINSLTEASLVIKTATIAIAVALLNFKTDVVYVTIGNPAFYLALCLTGVHFRGKLQHAGHVGGQKIKYRPIKTPEIGGVRMEGELYELYSPKSGLIQFLNQITLFGLICQSSNLIMCRPALFSKINFIKYNLLRVSFFKFSLPRKKNEEVIEFAPIQYVLRVITNSWTVLFKITNSAKIKLKIQLVCYKKYWIFQIFKITGSFLYFRNRCLLLNVCFRILIFYSPIG